VSRAITEYVDHAAAVRENEGLRNESPSTWGYIAAILALIVYSSYLLIQNGRTIIAHQNEELMENDDPGEENSF
jgi:hypothetical protein